MQQRIRYRTKLNSHSTLLNQSHSPFLRLPAELRNKIYHHVLSGHDLWISSPGGGKGSSTLSFRKLIQLNRVCRQMRHETINLSFSLNRFCGNFAFLEWFISHRDVPKDKLTNLRIECDYVPGRSLSEEFEELYYRPFRAKMEALGNLRKVVFVLDYSRNRWKVDRCGDEDVRRLMRMLGLDGRGVGYEVRHEHGRFGRVV